MTTVDSSLGADQFLTGLVSPMVTVGVLISLYLIIKIGGKASSLVAQFTTTSTMLESFRDSLCGYVGPGGLKRVVDKRKEDSVACEWITCDFCQCGWAALVFAGILLTAVGMPLPWLVVAWPATWREAIIED